MTLLETRKAEVAEEIRNGIREDRILGVCPNCESNLRIVKAKKSKKRFVGCSGYPDCTTTYPLPQSGKVMPTGETCDKCGSPKVKVVNKGRKPWVFCLDPECPTKKERKNKKAKDTDKAEKTVESKDTKEAG
jgi:DNA topoisomerase-1